MKKKLTTEQKVAQLTKAQQETVHKVGMFAIIGEIVLLIPFFGFFGYFMANLETFGATDNILEELRAIIIVGLIFVFLCFGSVGFIKGHFPYYSDSVWFYINKMKKGKVPYIYKQEEPVTTNRLYWIPIYSDNNESQLESNNNSIHVFPYASQMLNNGMTVPCETPFPQGYSFAQPVTGQLVRPKKIRNAQTGKEWISLFTDINYLFSALSPNTRVGLVDYETACGFAKVDANTCEGIVINPGRESKVINMPQIFRTQSYEQPQNTKQKNENSAKKRQSNIIVGIVFLVLFVLALYGATLQGDYNGDFLSIFFDFGDGVHSTTSSIATLFCYVGLFTAGVYFLSKREK